MYIYSNILNAYTSRIIIPYLEACGTSFKIWDYVYGTSWSFFGFHGNIHKLRSGLLILAICLIICGLFCLIIFDLVEVLPVHELEYPVAGCYDLLTFYFVLFW